MVKIFVLGLPCSGKSTVADYIAQEVMEHNWSSIRFNDYRILQEQFNLARIEEEKLLEQKENCNGFDIHDFSKLADVLEEINCETQSIRASEVEDFTSEFFNKTLTNLNYPTQISSLVYPFNRIYEERLGFIRRKKAALRKLLILYQYASNRIRDAEPYNSTPRKIEPPVGRVKIGGAHPDEKSHVVGTLYQTHIRKLAA